MRWLVGLLLVVATGCADPCARAEALNQDFRVKHEACFTAGTAPRKAIDVEACRDSLKTCSADDARAIDAYLTCVEGLDACTEATRQDWSEAFLACTTGMGALAPGCFYP